MKQIKRGSNINLHAGLLIKEVKSFSSVSSGEVQILKVRIKTRLPHLLQLKKQISDDQAILLYA